MKNTRIQKMIAVVMFAAIALVLQYFAFPIMPALGFLKIDFSDTPALVSVFLFGPAARVATVFLRSVLHLLTISLSPDDLVEDTASSLSATIFTSPIYYFLSVKRQHRGRNKFLGMVIGTIALTILMSITNYFAITPLYLMFLGLNAIQMLGMSLANYALIGTVLFNLIKGLVVNAASLVLHA